MDYAILLLGLIGLAWCGDTAWHLLTDDDCNHPDVGQSGECERCGANIEIGGSE